MSVQPNNALFSNHHNLFYKIPISNDFYFLLKEKPQETLLQKETKKPVPSNRACIAPRRAIFGSAAIADAACWSCPAKVLLGEEAEEEPAEAAAEEEPPAMAEAGDASFCSPKFSGHVVATMSPPTASTVAAASKGAVGPRAKVSTRTWARRPAAFLFC